MIRRELSWFLIIGISVTLIDYLIYRGLMWGAALDAPLAKAIGFLTGTVCAYFANRLLTFRHQEARPGSALRFGVLYASTLAANVAMNSLMLALLPEHAMRVNAAFVLATGVSAVLNFLGMKLFVFRATSLP